MTDTKVKSKGIKIFLAAGIPIAAIILAVVLALVMGNSGKSPVEISYFYDNVCGSCDYEGDFVNLFNEEVGDIKGQASYDLLMYNIFTQGEEGLDKACDRLEIPENERTTPILIIGDEYIKSDGAIKNNLREVFCSVFGINDENTLKYYFRPSCKDCERIKPFVDDIFTKNPDLPVKIIDTTEQAPKEKFKELLTELKIPNEEWEVPFVYYKGKYLSGDKEIEAKLEEFINENK